MITGLAAGIFWAIDTVILGIALAMTPFVSTEQAIFLAPFVSTFIHDFCSGIWMLIYMGVKKQYKNVIRALKTRSGKFIILGALFGGPIGMTGYVFAIKYLGPTYTAMISAMFPALGSFLSHIFLKERMKPIQMAGFAVSILAMVVMGYAPGGSEITNLGLGFACALLCVVGWAVEVVICAYGMKDPNVNNEQALMIRQLTSAIFYGVVIINVVRGWGFTMDIAFSKSTLVILAAAFFGTASYLCYYKAINDLGPSKGMALDITYSAWSIPIAFLVLRTIPDVKSIICGVVILAGSLIAATDIRETLGLKKKSDAAA
jgi:drug/metabolite transporter (DMT)-like permease